MAEETLRFLTRDQAYAAREVVGSPVYVYHEDSLRAGAKAVQAFPNAFGITPRYAMKASPNASILKIFLEEGLHIDASSGFECKRAMSVGYKADMMSLSSQELYPDFANIVNMGVKFNACSLNQLEKFGEAFAGTGKEVGVRFNPGAGSGGTGKTNVGGPSSSFGIWIGLLDEVKAIVAKYGLKVVRIHTHIGSGSDPAVWTKISRMSIKLCEEFPDVTTLNLGGGYKIGRMAYEAHKATNLQTCGTPIKEAMEAFAADTGRQLHLEIEPGTFLSANNCSLVTTVQDMVSTTTAMPEAFASLSEINPDEQGAAGYTFLKLDSGMTEVLRPSLYAAQHPCVVVPADPARESELESYVVVGHCCESGDLLTPDGDDAEALAPRMLSKAAIGDVCVIEGAGAYCSSMSSKNYNSFPEAPELMLRSDGTFSVIRNKQMVEQIWQNEVVIDTQGPVFFTKYHGLGNDFVMIDNRESSTPKLSPEQSVALCEAHFGIGGDGVIFVCPGREGCDYEMVIHNSDGSIPEMCGNGIRCMARFIQELDGSSGLERQYTIWTGAGKIVPLCREDGQVRVDMGMPILDGAKFDEQFTLAPTKDGKVIDATLNVVDQDFAVTCVSMGNPHAVIFVDDIAAFDVKKYGPPFEVASVFPQKTNTEFVEVKSDTHLVMKVWERGAAETLACGTGACALTVAAILAGKTEKRTMTVTLPGGDLEIQWCEAGDGPDAGKIFMTGPAKKSFSGSVNAADLLSNKR